MEKIISIRPNVQIMSLFNVIQNILKENRTEVFRKAMGKAYNEEVDWNEIVKIKRDMDIGTIDKIPEFLTLRIDEELLEVVVLKIKTSLGIKKLQMPYLIKAVLLNYICYLEEGEKEQVNIKLIKCEQMKEEVLFREKFIFNKKIATLLASNSRSSIEKFMKLKDFLDELEKQQLYLLFGRIRERINKKRVEKGEKVIYTLNIH